MEIVIKIPDEVLESRHYCQYFGAWSTKLTETIENGIPYNPSGDLISREALKEALYDFLSENSTTCDWEDIFNVIDNAPTVPIPNEQIAWEQGYETGLAQGKQDRPQVTVFAENADEKAVADLKAELQNVIEEKPQGEWEDYSVDFYKCPECGYLLNKCCPCCHNKVILPKGGAE